MHKYTFLHGSIQGLQTENGHLGSTNIIVWIIL